MKALLGVVLGVFLSVGYVYFYNLVYYPRYVEPASNLYWYVSCLAEVAYDKDTKGFDPFRVCMISKDQIKSIADRYQ